MPYVLREGNRAAWEVDPALQQSTAGTRSFVFLHDQGDIGRLVLISDGAAGLLRIPYELRGASIDVMRDPAQAIPSMRSNSKLG
jgi:hypothetical protein